MAAVRDQILDDLMPHTDQGQTFWYDYLRAAISVTDEIAMTNPTMGNQLLLLATFCRSDLDRATILSIVGTLRGRLDTSSLQHDDLTQGIKTQIETAIQDSETIQYSHLPNLKNAVQNTQIVEEVVQRYAR